MLVSLKWLKDYVQIDMPTKTLAHKLTMAGLAIDNIHKPGAGINNVVVGKIKSIEKHPQADRLVICRVDVQSGEEPLTIITGATNVQPEMKVPVALVGASLPNGVKISKANFRGIASYGMLCSAQELGIDPASLPEDERNGIMSLPQEAEVGQSVQKILGLDDEVLELELTPNRADCLSIINVAREVSAITGSKLQIPEIKESETSEETSKLATVEIANPEFCGRYSARVIKNVQVGKSPLWLKHRLESAGMRSINNIVDITNFVMLEMGQPLHAFDYDCLTGHHIVVRTAYAGEEILTLDNNKRTLDQEMLIIADEKKAVAIAGVMGGLESEVTNQTKTILLESANFTGASIRKTSRKLGLRSEASARYEKGINIEGTIAALNRAVDLIEKLGAGQGVPGNIDIYPLHQPTKCVKLRPERVNQILGINLSQETIINYLERLNMEVRVDGAQFTVGIPPYRQDISIEIDLIEEIARMFGYDEIPTTLPVGTMSQSKKSTEQLLVERSKDILTGCGMTEVITYSFISPKAFDKLSLEKEHTWRNVVTIKNPLSEEQSVMRTTLIPGLLEVATRNIKRRQTNISIFENGKVFLPRVGEALPEEATILAGLVTGEQIKTWNWPKEIKDFYYLKGIVEALFLKLNATSAVFKPSKSYAFLHPGRGAEILVENQVIGVIGEIHPTVLQNFELEQPVYVFELQTGLLLKGFKKVKTYQPLPKYPVVERDMAFLLPEKVTIQEVNDIITKVGGELLANFSLFDVYRGKQVPEGWKSIAYNLIYQAQDRTLTDNEVNELHLKIQSELKNNFQAQLRE
ncbi:phenylalanine--tRNA ligase subunit beta [Bacillota bacterium LX-D]|nr:phenylalanine--tRNA ligase subunit beta [Bacillota bacterium LX-D]